MNIIDDEEAKIENVSLEGLKNLLNRLEKIIIQPNLTFSFDPFANGIVITIRGIDTQGEHYGFRRVLPEKETLTLEKLKCVIDLFEYVYRKHNRKSTGSIR